MAQADQQAKSKERRIENLRKRVDDLKRSGERSATVGIILGILDLLADEL